MKKLIKFSAVAALVGLCSASWAQIGGDMEGNYFATTTTATNERSNQDKNAPYSTATPDSVYKALTARIDTLVKQNAELNGVYAKLVACSRAKKFYAPEFPDADAQGCAPAPAPAAEAAAGGKGSPLGTLLRGRDSAPQNAGGRWAPATDCARGVSPLGTSPVQKRLRTCAEGVEKGQLCGDAGKTCNTGRILRCDVSDGGSSVLESLVCR